MRGYYRYKKKPMYTHIKYAMKFTYLTFNKDGEINEEDKNIQSLDVENIAKETGAALIHASFRPFVVLANDTLDSIKVVGIAGSIEWSIPYLQTGTVEDFRLPITVGYALVKRSVGEDKYDFKLPNNRFEAVYRPATNCISYSFSPTKLGDTVIKMPLDIGTTRNFPRESSLQILFYVQINDPPQQDLKLDPMETVFSIECVANIRFFFSV